MNREQLSADPVAPVFDQATVTSTVDQELANYPVRRIEPSQGWASLGLRELWRFRELIYFFVWRDIKVRYKQTILGGAWAIIQPFCTMVIFSVIFGKLAKVPSESVPYPIFSFAGLVPWTFFANGVTQSSTSLVSDSNLVKKIYFPRLSLPISKVLSGIIDFVLAFLMLIPIMIYYHIAPTANIIWLPFFFLIALTTAWGVSIWFSAMHVQFRDVRYIIPFLVQIWLYATPIAYPSSLLPEPWRTIYGINPMVGVVEGFRWALLGTKMTLGPMLFISALASMVLLVSGIYYFRRLERTFADVI
jgi:lipopolysaccharide transport system permease protein